MATEQEITEALRLYTEGELRTKDIARQFKVSPSTITVWAKKAGLTLRPRGRVPVKQPSLRQRKILAMTQTHDYEAVGKHFGVSKQAVHQIVRRWGHLCPRSSPPYLPGDILGWRNKKLTVLTADNEQGTVVDQKGKIYRCFVWNACGRWPRKMGHRELTPSDFNPCPIIS